MKRFMGVYANPSGSVKGASYLEVFAQPLYVPAEHLVFNIGRRVGSGTRVYTRAELDLVDHDFALAGSFFDDHDSPAALLSSPWWTDRASVRLVETEAYSLIWCGRLEEAASVLDGIETLRLTRDWEHKVADRARHVQGLLGSSASAAMRQLDEWRDQSLRSLSLPTITMPDR